MTSTERTERALRDIEQCTLTSTLPQQTPREWAIEACVFVVVAAAVWAGGWL